MSQGGSLGLAHLLGGVAGGVVAGVVGVFAGGGGAGAPALLAGAAVVGGLGPGLALGAEVLTMAGLAAALFGAGAAGFALAGPAGTGVAGFAAFV